MSNAVVFAVISLVSTGFLDVLYKHSSDLKRSRGIFFLIGGIVWIVSQLILTFTIGRPIVFNAPTVFFGILSGILAIIGNIALVESLRKLDISVGSTIYRLNTVGVIILAFLFLGETLNLTKFFGVGLGILSVIIIYQHPGNLLSREKLKPYIILAIAASAFRAVYGVVSKYAMSFGANAEAILLLTAIGWTLGGAIYTFIRNRPIHLTFQNISYGAMAGLLVTIGAGSLLEALKYGDASIVTSIANLSFIVATLISIMTGLEKLTYRKFYAVFLAATSIILLTKSV